jgi:hypothetical protein
MWSRVRPNNEYLQLSKVPTPDDVKEAKWIEAQKQKLNRARTLLYFKQEENNKDLLKVIKRINY